MPFPKGAKKSGLTGIATALIQQNTDRLNTHVTVKSLEELLVESKEVEIKNRKVVGNLIVRLVKNKVIRPTGEYHGRYKLYEVVTSDVTATYPKQDEGLLDTGTIVSRSDKERLSKAKQELEEQLLAEMEKTEALEARVAELEGDHELDFVKLGESVYRAHQDLVVRYNRLESEHREEVDKHSKIHSEDRSMLGSLQKKVKKLEAENRSLRQKLQSGYSGQKPDMGIFNSPRLKGAP
jgi:hypothetical protein